MREYDSLGHGAFLLKYRAGNPTMYWVYQGHRAYPAKALIAAAHGYEFPSEGPLNVRRFVGGQATVIPKLRQLGFTDIRNAGPRRVRGPSRPRNPPWERDELILALDLYFRVGQGDDTDEEVVELSRVLTALPLHLEHLDPARFRNPNGVALKLANFAALDPDYPGVGMRRGGRRDREVWDEFHEDRERLRELARAINKAASTSIQDMPVEEGEEEADEGRILFRLHRSRERNPGIVAKKKRLALRRHGRLACEVCGFDFEATYSHWGQGFIECHHNVPLSETGQTRTRLSDLLLTCANCHRILHRGAPRPDASDLRAILK